MKKTIKNKKQTPSQYTVAAETQAKISLLMPRIEQTWKACRDDKQSTSSELSEGESAFIRALEALFVLHKNKEVALMDIQKSLEPLLAGEPTRNQDKFRDLLSMGVFANFATMIIGIVDAKNDAEFNALLKLGHRSFFTEARFTAPCYRSEDQHPTTTEGPRSVPEDDRNPMVLRYSLHSYIFVHGTAEMLETLMQHLNSSKVRHPGKPTSVPIAGITNPLSHRLFVTPSKNVSPEDISSQDNDMIRRCEILLSGLPLKGRAEVCEQLIMRDYGNWKYFLPPLLFACIKNCEDPEGLKGLKLARYLIQNGGVAALTQLTVAEQITTNAVEYILEGDQVGLLQLISQKDLETLMNRGWKQRDNDTTTLFQCAIVRHSMKCMQYLLRGKLVNDVDVKVCVPRLGGEVTALMVAVERGDLELVQRLLRKKANPNIQGRDLEGKEGYGPTALVMAVRRLGGTAAALQEARDRRAKVVEALLDAGADPNQGAGLDEESLEQITPAKYVEAQTWKQRPLYAAIVGKEHDLMELLIRHGAEPDPETDPWALRPVEVVLQRKERGFACSERALEILVRAWNKDPHTPRRYPGGFIRLSLAGLGFFVSPDLLRWLCEAKKFSLDQAAGLGSDRSFRSYFDDTNDTAVTTFQQREVNGRIVESIRINRGLRTLLASKEILEQYGLLGPGPKQGAGIEVMAHDASVSSIDEGLVLPMAAFVPQAMGGGNEVMVCGKEAGEVIAEGNGLRPVFSEGLIYPVDAEPSRSLSSVAGELLEIVGEGVHPPPSRGGSNADAEALDAKVAAVTIGHIQREQEQVRLRALKELNRQQQGSPSSKGAASFQKKAAGQQIKKKKAQAEVTSLEHSVNQVSFPKLMSEPVVASVALPASSPEADLTLSSLDGLLFPYEHQLPSKQAESSEHAGGSRHREKQKPLPAPKLIGMVASNTVGGAQDLLKVQVSRRPQLVQHVNSVLRARLEYRDALKKLHGVIQVWESLKGQQPLEQRPYIGTILTLAVLKYILELANFMVGLSKNHSYSILGTSDALRNIGGFRNRLARCGTVPEARLIWDAVQRFVIACEWDDPAGCSSTLADQFWINLCEPLLLWYEQQREGVNSEQWAPSNQDQELCCLNGFRALQEAHRGIDDHHRTTEVPPGLVPAASGFLLMQMWHTLGSHTALAAPDGNIRRVWTAQRNRLAHHGPCDDEKAGLVLSCTTSFLEEMAGLLEQRRLLFGPESLISSQGCLSHPPVLSSFSAAVSLESVGQDYSLEPRQPSSGVPTPIGAERAARSLSTFFSAPALQESSETVVSDQNLDQEHREACCLQSHKA